MKPNQLRNFLALCLFAAATAPAAVRYVDVNSASPAPPYTNWSTAAVTIQDAVDAAVAGDQILVTNGVYSTGGRNGNRVVVDKPVAVQSVNGPQPTVINGGGSVRCVYLTNGASLAGFTLRNGFAHVGGGAYGGTLSNCTLIDNTAQGPYSGGGGALECILNDCRLLNNSCVGEETSGGGASGGTLNNCVLNGNSASFGGGASGAVLNNCTLTGNAALPFGSANQFGGRGGGAYFSTLTNCTLNFNSAEVGGGVDSYNSVLNKCTLIGNSASFGGGVSDAVLNNCILRSNHATTSGGGAYQGTLNNCTLTGNSASVQGGGEFNSEAINCIVYGNSAPDGANYVHYLTLPSYCCTVPDHPGSIGNITNAPLFVDQAAGNLRLQSNSPCINSGRNTYAPVGLDLDGNPRIAGGTVDIGAYEFQSPASVISYAWLQKYGFPTDGSADYVDSDSDLSNNWQEWIAETVPTNALSVLRLLNPTNNTAGVTVSWQSVFGRTYFLERSTNLGAMSPFSLVTSIFGQPGMTSYTDPDATGPGPFFYRVGVQQ